MRTFLTSSISVLSLLAFGALAAGCNEESVVDESAPEFEDEQGQSAKEEVVIDYPDVPKGIDVGSVVANYQFLGFPDPVADKSNAYPIQMADFYNPTGDGTYPEGSAYGAGKLKPTVLLVVISAVWCQPCQIENRDILPGEHEEYGPRGAEFILQLSDGPTYGEPATFKHLISWTTKYDTAWPAVIDPSSKLMELADADAFPANILIDTKTMTIVDRVAGIPQAGSSFYTKLEGLLRPE